MASLVQRRFVSLLLQGSYTLGCCASAFAASSPLPLHGSVAFPTTMYPVSSGKQTPMTLMQKGQQYLAANQFAQAEECFRQSVVEHPTDPYVHYFLANALVYSRKHPEAMEEYTRAYRLDPYGPISGYCRKALEAYRLHSPTAVSESEPAPIINAAERLGSKAPEEGHRGESVHLIRSQVEREKIRHRHYAESIASTIVRGGETRAQLIEHNAHDAINDILNSPLRIRPFEHPMAAMENRRMQVEQMRKEAEEAAKMERSMASEKSDAYKRWSLEHEFSLDEIASNLEGQLLTKALPGSAQLRPEGTGLFVRYYGKSNVAADVHNSVAHFTDHHAFASADEADSAEPDESGKLLKKLSSERPQQVRESTVRGAVIK